MSASHVQGADLRRYLEPYWRRRWLVLAILILIPAGVYGASKLVEPRYEASTTLLVRSTNFSSQAFTTQISVATGSAAAAARLVTTTPVARAAARKLDEPSSDAGALLGAVSVDFDDSDTSSQFMTITATSDDPDRAADIANAFAKAITVTRTDEAVADINNTIKTLQAQAERNQGSDEQAVADALDEELQQLQGLRASQQGTTQVIEKALPPASPVAPKPARNAALGFVLALLLAAGIVPLADRLNRRLRDPDELAATIGEQLLATIPESAFPGQPPSPAARESFQTLRAGLRYFNLDRPLSTIVITSPLHADGKTTVATNVALAMARDGSDVVLLDADLRRPRVAERLGADGGHNLEAVLVDDVALSEALQEVDAGGEAAGGRLRVLASADPSPNPAALLSSARMRELLAELADAHDVVVVDTPPLLVVSDAIPLLAPASGVVLVSRLNQTGIEAIGRGASIIEAAGGRLLGGVATGAKAGAFDYYGYGYGDEPPAENEGRGSRIRIPGRGSGSA